MSASPFPTRPPLRNDPSGWQIEDDTAAEAALQAIEAAGGIILELLFHRISRLPFDTDVALALRGIGTLAGRHGLSTLSHLTGIDEAGRRRNESAELEDAGPAAGGAMREILHWLLEWSPDPDQPPELRKPSPPPPSVQLALDELHAAAIYLDRRSANAGLTGPGRKRTIVRSTTRRRGGR